MTDSKFSHIFIRLILTNILLALFGIILLALLCLSIEAKGLPNIPYDYYFFQGKSGGAITKVTALPTTCTAVGAVDSTNPVIYQGRTYHCTSPNTWTAVATGSGVTANSTTAYLPYLSAANVFSDSPISRVDASTVQVLAINGGSAANDDLILQGTSNGTRTSSYVLIQPNGGNVGIGTSSPSSAFGFSPALHFLGSAPAYRLQSNGGSNLEFGSDTARSYIATTTNHSIRLYANNVLVATIQTNGTILYNGIAHASLPAATDGSQTYCSDCTKGSTPCTSGSTGSFAKRENGAWNCD